MVNAFGMQNLETAPAVKSRHTEGRAVDMSISGLGTLRIRNAKGEAVEITTVPLAGMNSQLPAVGNSYGVIKFRLGSPAKPHGADDGR